MTPLHYAAQNNQNGAKTSEHLLNKASYALINWQDHKGRTALHLGIVSKQSCPKFCPKRFRLNLKTDPTMVQIRTIQGFDTSESDKRIKYCCCEIVNRSRL